MSSLGRRALSGVAWNWGASVALGLVQIGATAAAARLVAPEEFGLYATGQAAIALGGFFTMAAVAGGLLRRSSLSQAAVGTATTISLVSSLTVAAAFWLGAPLWAGLWGAEDAADVVRVFAMALFVRSAATVPITLVRRRLAFRSAALIEIGSQGVGLLVGVAFAVALHSAVALAFGQLAGAILLLVAATAASRSELSLAYDRAELRELMTFSSQVGGLGLLSYVNNTAPAWFAARAFGVATLGFYSRANMIVALPANYASSSIAKVLYPIYGHVRDDPARTRKLVDESLLLTTGIAWPFFGLLAGGAPVVVAVLLGPGWEPAVPFVPLVALAACAFIPAGLLTNAAEAMGWMRIIVTRQGLFLAGVAATLGVAAAADLEMTAVLASVAGFQWLIYILTVGAFIRRGVLERAAALRAQGLHAVVAAICFGLAAGVSELLATAPVSVRAFGLGLVALLCVGILFAIRSHLPAGRALDRRIRLALRADSPLEPIPDGLSGGAIT